MRFAFELFIISPTNYERGETKKKKKQKHLKSNEKRSHPFRIWQIVYVSIFALFLLIFQSSAEKNTLYRILYVLWMCIEFYVNMAYVLFIFICTLHATL